MEINCYVTCNNINSVYCIGKVHLFHFLNLDFTASQLISNKYTSNLHIINNPFQMRLNSN